MLGRPYTAMDFERLGIINYVVPADQVEASTLDGERLASVSVRLTAPATASELPPGLFTWLIRMPSGVGATRADDLDVKVVWRGEGTAWAGGEDLDGEAWWVGVRYRFPGAQAL